MSRLIFGCASFGKVYGKLPVCPEIFLYTK